MTVRRRRVRTWSTRHTGTVNRLVLHESVAELAPHELIGLAADAGFDSIWLRVAHSPGADRWWRKGAGAAELHHMIDELLGRRVSVLDVGRIDLTVDDDESYRHVLDLASRVGARHVTAAAPVGAAADPVAAAFAGLVAHADAYGLVPLLVPQAGSPVATETQALELHRAHGGAVVLAVTVTDTPADIETRVVDAGNRLGYLRLMADDLDGVDDLDGLAVAGLLATVPAHVPVAVGARRPGALTVQQVSRWAQLIDRMLEHPRARERRETR